MIICKYYDLKYEEINEFWKKRENSYLVTLLMKNFKCLNNNELRKSLGISNNKSLYNKVKIAEEKILINKSFGLAILCCVLIWKIIYNAFNPSHDSFDDLLKKLSIFAICFWIPIFISTYQTKKYTFIFDKALKQQKD